MYTHYTTPKPPKCLIERMVGWFRVGGVLSGVQGWKRKAESQGEHSAASSRASHSTSRCTAGVSAASGRAAAQQEATLPESKAVTYLVSHLSLRDISYLFAYLF